MARLRLAVCISVPAFVGICELLQILGLHEQRINWLAEQFLLQVHMKSGDVASDLNDYDPETVCGIYSVLRSSQRVEGIDDISMPGCKAQLAKLIEAKGDTLLAPKPLPSATLEDLRCVLAGDTPLKKLTLLSC